MMHPLHRRYTPLILFLAIIITVAHGFSARISSSTTSHPPLALVTGGTGRTGQVVTQLLLQKGLGVRILARNVTQAQQILEPLLTKLKENNDDDDDDDTPVLEFCQGDVGNATAVQAAFVKSTTTTTPVTHVVFCAGGDNADYYAVNYRGVVHCAQQASQDGSSVQQMVVISTAWASKPYSIASLLFNTLFDTIPMACHFLGEEAVRQASRDDCLPNYVILRAGGLNSDERYAEKYPNVDATRLTYQQGDSFEFLGPAGRPGMCRTQLAHAVATAVNVPGRYTVEVTGSGPVDMDDATVYPQRLVQDDESNGAAKQYSEGEVFDIHQQALVELRSVGMGALIAGIALIARWGWGQGLLAVVAVDAVLVGVWSQFYANRQT